MFNKKRGLIAALMLPLTLGGYSPVTFAAQPASNEVQTKQQAISAMFAQADYAPKEIIVQYKSEGQAKSAQRIAASVRVARQSGKTALIKVDSGNLLQVAAQFANDPNVAYVEPNYLFELHEDPAPVTNDPSYYDQYGLPLAHVPEAWELLRSWSGPTKSQVTVAVLDTGVETTHPDLQNRVQGGFNTVDDNTDPTDRVGHGTHVAGIIAAEADNGIGVAGVTGKLPVKVLPIKVIGDNGKGNSLTVAKGIDKAVELGADIINMSLGGTGNSKLVEEAVKRATAKGVLIICSAGNKGTRTETQFPALYADTLTVASVGSTEQSSSFSNYGSAVDIAAPGERILSTYVNQDYRYLNGTSMATPLVAGAAALIKYTHPSWGPTEIRNALEKTSKDIDKPGFDAATGNGLVQIDAALQYDNQQAPIQVLSPNQGDYLWGDVTFDLRILTPQATQIEVRTEAGKKLGVFKISENMVNFNWDSRLVTDGNHLLMIQAMDTANHPVGQPMQLSVKVKNQNESGIRVQALDFTGQPAYGSSVQLYRYGSRTNEDGTPAADNYSMIFQAMLNDHGLAYIPQELIQSGERYLAVILNQDPDQDGVFYTSIHQVTPDSKEITADISRSQTFDVQTITNKNGQTNYDNTTYAFLPVIDGTEVHDLAMISQPDEQGNLKATLSPGRYAMYAYRLEPTGINFFLRQEVEVGDKLSKVTFNLSEAKQFGFHLPQWVKSGTWAPQVDGLTLPQMQVTNKTRLFVNPGQINYTLELAHDTEDDSSIYGLKSVKPFAAGSQRYLQVADPAIRVDKQVSGTYRKGDAVETSFQLRFGDEQVLKTIYGASPGFVLLDEKGEEVWSVGGAERMFYIPTGESLTAGRYQLYVDYSDTTLPLKTKTAKLGEITIVDSADTSTSTEVSVTGPEGEDFGKLSVSVYDPRSKRLIEQKSFDFISDPFGGFGNDELPFEKLEAGQDYLVRIAGVTEESVPVLVERVLTAEAEDWDIDLSEPTALPRKIAFQLPAGSFTDVALAGDSAQTIRVHSDSNTAWLDPIAYDLTVFETTDQGYVIYPKPVKVSKATAKIKPAPVKSKLVPVTITDQPADGQSQTHWSVGVSRNPSAQEFDLFPLTEGKTLYVQPADYRFQLLRQTTQNEVNTTFLLDAQPVKSKNGYVFEAGDTFTAELQRVQADEQNPDTVVYDVNVHDTYSNKIQQIAIVVYDESTSLSVPLRMTTNSNGQWTVAAYDSSERTYRPVSTQVIEPGITVRQGDTMIHQAKAEAYWNRIILPQASQWGAGDYTLTWSVGYPELLTTQISFTTNE
ncbi:S8 family peptidase [Brevibacillus dissolubilis]|uniref:S8 family peptidase n=1 Tax=Brevibacillus dissolubilis TaxID=1844116 RepID=UPI0011175DC2|nr:S8 family peptidase [Brevibacillus dissolubilis]